MKAMLKHFFLISGVVWLIAGMGVALAGETPMVVEEHFATLMMGDETYTNVTITKISKTDVFFQHARGMGNVKLKSLSPALQKHFTPNTGEAAKVEKAQASANAKPHQQAVNAPQLEADAHARELDTNVAEGLEVGKKFPGFTVKDLGGQKLSVAGLRGKVVLIDFWATWCSTCQELLPDVQAAYQKFHSEGFEIIGISLDKDRKTLDRFIQKAGLMWPQYFDGGGWDNKLARQYGVNDLPTTFLLNRQGVIVAKNLHGSELAKAVGRALAK